MRLSGWVSSLMLVSGGSGWIVAANSLADQSAAKSEPVNFGRDILPILSDKCFKCHGPDAGSRQVGMRLDTAEGAFADRGGKWPVVPGKPESSMVVQRIHSKDSPMPPVFSGKSLTEGEKELITRWIAEGAKYGKLWSFESLPDSVPVPHVKGNWALDDLDRFVLDRLDREGLKPSAPAPRWRWLRRVTLDLTGLPPTEEEISEFESDRKPGAFERVVDRLLTSEHFGERMAVEWLDAARYADSYGYQSDLLMPTWPFRDWVIRAFNDNLPYDQFLTWQLAGDLLPNATRDQILATAFNRLHRQSNEGGSIPLEFKTEYAVDRVDTFGTAVLGLTVGCARCHDHKFDPIKQNEYYQLFAYFNSIDEFGLLLSTEIVPTPSLLLPTSEQETKLAKLQKQYNDAMEALDIAKSRARIVAGDWLKKPTDIPRILGQLARISFETEEGGKLKNDIASGVSASRLGNAEMIEGRQGRGLQFDGETGLVVRGIAAKERWDPFTWSFWISDPRNDHPVVLLHRTGGTDVGFCGFDLTLENGYLTARVMRHWPGNAVAIRTRAQIPKDRWTHVAWSWDGSGRASGLRLFIDGEPAPSEVLSDRLWKKINAYGDLGASGGDWAFGQRFRDSGFKSGKLDEVSFVSRSLCDSEVKSLYDGRPIDRDAEFYVSAVDPAVQQAEANVRKAQMALANEEENVYEISVMEEAKPEIPAYLLARGRYDAPRNEETKVSRGVPASLPMLSAEGANNRLALAKWATRRDNPLTARVAVNRIWQMLFGVGLVETSENFGVQGSQPSNPRLLDSLAMRFINDGWDVKKMLKQIVLSATYRQDSVRTKLLLERDPQNRLLARGPSLRLSAEMTRDSVLFASGLLNTKFGGAPVNAYQPPNIWSENNTMSPSFVQSTGKELYRRSLYSTWKRTTPVPNMMLFDATSREACSVRRQSTDTPLQALVLLNDVQFVEGARVLAELVLKAPGNDESRIKKAFVRLAGRYPDADETKLLLRSLGEQRLQFRRDVLAAARLIEVGDSKADPSLRPTELAAMTVTVQTILNSDSVIWKR